jgi:saccharopine dehydrogenase-like NADP-dependent oxidoreductase
MREIEPEVVKAGIVVLNEVGVDPGVDHLYAIKMIDEVHEKGGEVRVSGIATPGWPLMWHR